MLRSKFSHILTEQLLVSLQIAMENFNQRNKPKFENFTEKSSHTEQLAKF